MSQTITLDTTTAKNLVKELERLDNLKRKIASLLPESLLQKGSDLWWEREIQKGREELANGKGIEFSGLKALKGQLRI